MARPLTTAECRALNELNGPAGELVTDDEAAIAGYRKAIRKGIRTILHHRGELRTPRPKVEKRKNEFPSTPDQRACCEEFEKTLKAGKQFTDALYKRIARWTLLDEDRWPTVKTWKSRWAKTKKR